MRIVSIIAFQQIFNIYLMNWVFNNFWVEYLPTIFAFLDGDLERFSRHAAVLFPTQVKCLYNDFGPSGSQQERDALCFLPQNTINEKIFVFLYFWFIIMLVVGLFQLFVSTILLASKKIRKFWIFRVCQLQAKVGSNFSDIGTFFMLTRISMNLNCNLFADFVEELAAKKEPETVQYL